jgi:hypothetical protein
MNYFISYNQYKKQIVLNETYESYQELKILAEEISAKINIFNSSINKLYPLSKLVQNSRYTVIKDFITNQVCIIITDQLDTPAAYVSNDRYDLAFGNNFRSKHENICKTGVILIRPTSKNSSALIHELEHAWDDYRSKGKLLNTKLGQKYKEKAEKYISQQTGKSAAYDPALTTLYYRTPHEISAYFVEVLEEINFFRDESEMYLRDFKDLYEEFVEKFQGYEYLTPKDKKILARKFSQYYYKLKERNIYEE